MVKKLTLLLAIAVIAQITWAQSNVSLVEVNLDRYALRSVNNPISLKIKNNGKTTVNTLKLNWSDGLDSHTATVRTDIPAGETATVTHPTPVNYSSVVEKNITVSIDMVNESKDFNATNNSQSIAFNTITKRATKAVVFEEATGTWCGWCPGGAVNMENMKKKYSKTFIGIAVHGGNSDPMKYGEYYNFGSKIGIFDGYPTYGCDRANSRALSIQGEMSMERPYKQRIKEEAPADLFASATLSGSNLKINAGAQFYSSFSNAKFKLSVVITEDGVTGRSSSYNQANYYSGGSRKMGGYEKKPRTVPARDMVYDHVARAVLGRFSGQSGSVPSKIKAGDKANYSFSYKIPSRYNKNKLNIIVLLINSKGQIVNGKEIKLDQALSVEKAEIASMKIYPNPAKNNLTLDFDATDSNYNVSIHDITGRSIYNKEYSNLNNGMQSLNIPLIGLKSGNYIVNINSNKASHSKLITVKQ